MKTNVLRVLALLFLLCAMLGICLLLRGHPDKDPNTSMANAHPASILPRAPATTAPVAMRATSANRPIARETESALFRKISLLKISAPVAVIVGLDQQGEHYNARVKALHQLTRRLSAADCQALELFLGGGQAGRRSLKPLEFDGVKNDALGILLKQEKVPNGIGDLVLDMYRDPENDPTWRDYCLQYMVPCYDALAAAPAADTNAAGTRAEIEQACWNALAEKNQTSAGTSLITLETLAKTHPQIDAGKVADAALALANDDACGEATRITALRVCAEMGKSEVLATAKVLAQTGETIPLRMAALATVGDLGGKNDAELLRSLAADADKRIADCSKAALARMNRRIEPKAGQ